MLSELVTGAWPFGIEVTTQAALERATREAEPAGSCLQVTPRAAEQRAKTVPASAASPHSSNPLQGANEGPTAVQVLENAAGSLDSQGPRDALVETELRTWLM